MKKIRQFFTKLICVILVTVSLTNTVYFDYNADVVNAAELVTTMEMLQALLEMFGVSVGLGAQSDYFSQETFNDFATAVSNGTVYHMDQYGDVDFSDDASVQDWLEWANGIDEYITTSGWSPVDKYNTAIKAGAVLLDSASYKMTGTSATTAMHSYIDDLISTFGVSGGGTISLDARDAYSFFGGAGAGDNDDDDDEEAKKKRYKTRFAYFTGLTGALILTMGDSLTELVGLKHPETSDFSEYDAAFEDNFNGNYLIDTSGQYVCDVFYETGGGIDNGYKICKYKWHYVGSRQIFGYLGTSGGYSRYYFGYFLGTPLVSNFKSVSVGEGVQTNLSTGHGGGYSANSSLYVLSENSFSNVPIFSSLDAAVDYFSTGDTSGILNLNDDTAYINYKDNAPSAAVRLPKYLDGWIMSPEYLQKLPSMITPVLDAADSSAGMTNSIDAVEDAIMEIAPDDVIDTEPDPVPDDPADYSGILGRILSVLKSIWSAILAIPTVITAIPDKVIEYFKNPLDLITATLSSLLEVILNLNLSSIITVLPDKVFECFKNPIDSIIGYLSDILDVILTLPATITILPNAIFECFKDPAAALTAIPDSFQNLLDLIDILVGFLTPVPSIVTLLTDLQAWLAIQWAEHLAALDTIAANPKFDSPIFDEPGTPHISLLNGVVLLIYILLMLLRIFLHLLEFVINVFKIPADPGFITGDFALGFEYIKSVELVGMGVSVYDFLMGLIHIIIIFNIVKLLRNRIEKFHL